jgi:uncharacterized protein
MVYVSIFLIASFGLLALGYHVMSTMVVARNRVHSEKKSGDFSTHDRVSRVKEELQRLNESHLAQARPISGWRDVVIAKIVDETPSCKSFYLLDPCQERLPRFLPGQHIVIEAQLSPNTKAVRRCYSLSSIPEHGYWRITVKRYGGDAEINLPEFLHREARIGQTLHIRGPQGEFTSQVAKDKPLVLLAAGIGITPLISMLESWARSCNPQPLWLFYQVRDEMDVPFLRRIQEVESIHPHFQFHLYITRPTRTASGFTYTAGRVDIERVVAATPDAEPYYFMCGPEEWMSNVASGLIAHGIEDDRIVYESFGGNHDVLPRKTDDIVARNQAGQVTFVRASQTAEFNSQSSNLLELAESCGVAIESGCRAGNCGSCITKIIQGSVKYRHRPQCDHADDEIVACVAEPVGDIVLDA